MTREDIEKEYRVISGIITSPGKFEGEPVYAPHYWNLGLEGGADEDDGESYVFHLDSSDVLLWPELSSIRTLRLVEDDSGFIHTFRECHP